MKIEELKQIMLEHSNDMGPVPEYISNNSVHDILCDGYDQSGKKILRFSDVNYYTFYINSEDIVLFELKEEGKYYVYLRYSKDEQENIAHIESIQKLDAKAYGVIQQMMNDKKKQINDFLDEIYDNDLEKQLILVNTFSTTKK